MASSPPYSLLRKVSPQKRTARRRTATQYVISLVQTRAYLRHVNLGKDVNLTKGDDNTNWQDFKLRMSVARLGGGKLGSMVQQYYLSIGVYSF
jgi:hypothetical protein